MTMRTWLVRLVVLLGVIAFVGTAVSGCKSSGSSCGDSNCTSKH